mmetsp:Transcript_11496/g.22007  ORF Transcript_11496/g.22007 Transcript_11496/m.22007 type:complete len:89 (+) Transcript_11496:1133-1399(+)
MTMTAATCRRIHTCLIRFIMMRAFFESSPLVISSNMMIFGLSISAQARASRFFSPPESPTTLKPPASSPPIGRAYRVGSPSPTSRSAV